MKIEYLRIESKGGYKWLFEMTQDNDGSWKGSLYMGGILYYSTPFYTERLWSELLCSTFIINNPYYK